MGYSHCGYMPTWQFLALDVTSNMDTRIFVKLKDITGFKCKLSCHDPEFDFDNHQHGVQNWHSKLMFVKTRNQYQQVWVLDQARRIAHQRLSKTRRDQATIQSFSRSMHVNRSLHHTQLAPLFTSSLHMENQRLTLASTSLSLSLTPHSTSSPSLQFLLSPSPRPPLPPTNPRRTARRRPQEQQGLLLHPCCYFIRQT